MRTQEQIFDDIRTLSIRVSQLSGFVQNDFGRMIEDGYVKNEELEESLISVEKEFGLAMRDLERHKVEVIETIKSHII